IPRRRAGVRPRTSSLTWRAFGCQVKLTEAATGERDALSINSNSHSAIGNVCMRSASSVRERYSSRGLWVQIMTLSFICSQPGEDKYILAGRVEPAISLRSAEPAWLGFSVRRCVMLIILD